MREEPQSARADTEQTTLGAFDLWRVERVLPRHVGGSTEGREDNILQLYARMTDEDREDSIEFFRDLMFIDEELEVLDSFSHLDDEMDFRDSGLIEQEDIVDEPVGWRVLWGKGLIER